MKKIRASSVSMYISGLLFALLFGYIVYSSQLIPLSLLVAAGVALLLVFLLLSALVAHKKSKFLVAFGGILSLLLGLVLLLASIYLTQAVNTAQSITTRKTERAAVSVYMLSEYADASTELTADLRYGILDKLDRENTDATVSELKNELGSELSIRSFDNTLLLIDALDRHDIDAIILNSAYLDIAAEMEGYTDVKSRLVEIRKIHIEQDAAPAATRKPLLPIFQSGRKDENRDYPVCFAMYISGIDSRVGLIEKSRCDVNILMVVNTETHQILLVTTPRDYYVPLPISNGIRDKLTHAGIYGVDVSVGTLEMLYDIDIDYYFRVNFSGFENIVDAMGGVNVYSEKSFSGQNYYFPEGYNQLNGAQALEFVRTREGIGDQQRGRNHMAFIKAVIEKATSTDMLRNFSATLSSVEDSFETSMPYDVLSALVRDQLSSGASWNIVSYNVTGEGASRTTYSMNEYLFVFIPDENSVQTAKNMMQQVYRGEIPTQP